MLLVLVALLEGVLTTLPPSFPPSPALDDWHFPLEEADELAAAVRIRVSEFRATSNSTGTVEIVGLPGVGWEVATAAHTIAVGEQALNWTLRSFLIPATGAAAPTYAVLERDWGRWGALIIVQDASRQPSLVAGGAGWPPPLCPSCSVAPQNPCAFIRKGVGKLAALRRPQYSLQAADEGYFDKAASEPHDWLRQRFVSHTPDHEPTFVSAASVLTPALDYSEVGNRDAHSKFSVAPDGRVSSANFSIRVDMRHGATPTGGGGPGAGNHLLFDPRNHTSFWPASNWTEFKLALVGRVSRAVSVGVWEPSVERGFSLLATPHTARGIRTVPYDPALLLLRIEEQAGAGAPHPAATATATPPPPVVQYFAVESGGGGASLADPGTFYEQLLLHTTAWAQFHQGARHCSTDGSDGSGGGSGGGSDGGRDGGGSGGTSGGSGGTSSGNRGTSGGTSDVLTTKPARAQDLPLELQLRDGNRSTEGRRLTDMARAVLSAALSAFVGLRPNYGDGGTYWGVASEDRGALPLESFAVGRGLLLWGHPAEAARLIEHYFNVYVRNASGVTPRNDVEMSREAFRRDPGGIDFKGWDIGRSGWPLAYQVAGWRAHAHGHATRLPHGHMGMPLASHTHTWARHPPPIRTHGHAHVPGALPRRLRRLWPLARPVGRLGARL